MKRKHLIILIIVIVLAIVVAGGYLIYQKGKKQEPIAGEVTMPKLTYSTFTSEIDPITFVYPEEWIQISPAEIEKAIPAESREKTNILMYAASPQNIILMASKTVSGPGEASIEQTVAEVIGQTERIDPNLKEEYKDIGENEATVEVTCKLQGNMDWSIRFRVLLYHTAEQDILYAVQLTLPKTLRGANQEIIDTILSSFKIEADKRG